MNISTLIFGLLVLSLSACGGKSKKPTHVIYDVTLTNATANQPLSPPAVILHELALQAWLVGSSASDGLEMLAEGGMPDVFVAELLGNEGVFSSVTGDALVMPGESVVLRIEASINSSSLQNLSLTAAAMPVNTNDAFTGVTAKPLKTLMPGDTLKALLPIYDAGTEYNSENAAHIPGPAGQGEGYNSERNDVNYVAYHPGVVTMDDGYADSTLDVTHKVDQGGMILSVLRIQ